MKEKLTLKQKDRIARNIYKNYQRAQLDILYMNQHYNHYPQIDLFRVKDSGTHYQKADAAFIAQLEKKQHLEEFVGIINQIHTHLSKENFRFLESEYLNFYDEMWWMPYYSRASYYRLKHKALDNLFEYASTFWSDEEILALLR